jgi:protein-disulfide isomerase
MSKQSRDQSRTQRAAAIRAAQARKERNRRVGLVVGIVVLLGAIVAAGAWFGPFCRELEASTRDFLRENADKGRVYVEYRPINLLRQYDYSAKSLNAWAAVLKNASPNAALKVHNLFFDKQPYEQASDQVTDSQIAAWVKEAGGDNAKVREAMKTKDTDYFDAAQADMNKEKISGTPTVFINGKELPVTAVTDMVSKIEAAVEQGNK